MGLNEVLDNLINEKMVYVKDAEDENLLFTVFPGSSNNAPSRYENWLVTSVVHCNDRTTTVYVLTDN